MDLTLQQLNAADQLMKAIGSPSFDPMPPSQHQWQRGKSGDELAIHNIAKDLGMDAHNASACWLLGVERGLWRNGTQAEGKRRLRRDLEKERHLDHERQLRRRPREQGSKRGER